MNEKQIAAALDAGIIDAAQAKAMRAKLKAAAKPKAPAPSTPAADSPALIGNEDDMRFMRSFSDVFIAIGIGLLAFGLFGLCGLFGGGPVYLLGAAGLWVMAEYFGKKKRAHLPTLLLSLAFLVFVQTGASAVMPSVSRLPGVFAAIVTLGAMLLFYWRFRLPFSIALIAISIAVLAYSFIGRYMPLGAFLMLSGLVFFAAAIAYDMRDTDRLTRFADNAFWLHFAAAPLILHGIAIQILSLKTTKLFGVVPVPGLEKSDALIMLLIIGALALIGLAINRRALLVSSLGYAALAIAMLIKDTGLGFGSAAATTLLLLGGGIVFLGAGWHGARRWVLKPLPTQGIFAKIFPPAGP